MTVTSKGSVMPGATAVGQANSTMKMESHRLGDCDAKPAG